MANYWNSTFSIKPNARRLRAKKQIKRGGKTEGHPRDASGSFLPKPGARSEKNCPNCGMRYWYWTAKPPKSCSRACTYALSKKKTRAERKCQFCGVTFSFVLSTLRTDPRRGKYCSTGCRNKAKVKRHEEKGTPERYKNEAHLIGDKLWKESVRKRDNYTCQRCGKYELYIQAHHVAPRSRRPDLIRVIENGKCLCNSCHTWVHMHPKEATALGLLSDESYERVRKQKLTCKICGDNHSGLGFCQKHYARFKKYGDPLLTRPRGGSPQSRLQVVRVTS